MWIAPVLYLTHETLQGHPVTVADGLQKASSHSEQSIGYATVRKLHTFIILIFN